MRRWSTTCGPQFERHGVEERHRVDLGARSPAEVAEEIDRRLRAGEFRLEGQPGEPGEPGEPDRLATPGG